MLELYTEFELATAQQLAYERNRDEPTEQDFKDEIKKAAKWKKQRQQLGLRLLKWGYIK